MTTTAENIAVVVTRARQRSRGGSTPTTNGWVMGGVATITGRRRDRLRPTPVEVATGGQASFVTAITGSTKRGVRA
jgi:hypothetical protein